MTEPKAGVVLEHGKVRMEFVVTSAESDGDLHQMRVTYQPHSDPPPSHIHPAQDETFEILDGEVEFTLDGIVSVHAASATVEVPRGTSMSCATPRTSPPPSSGPPVRRCAPASSSWRCTRRRPPATSTGW